MELAQTLVLEDECEERPPLAVDLDCTLIWVDSLHESFLGTVRQDWLAAIKALFHLRAGRAAFKRHVADQTALDAASLPYNEPLLRYLQEEASAGRQIGLFTAADQSIADAVAAHIGLFDVVHGSDGRENLRGTRKLAAIRAAFGDRFAYAGDAEVDGPLFRAASSVVLVGETGRLEKMVGPQTAVEARFEKRRAGLRTWVRALRIRHWAKNSLVFVAPTMSLGLLDPVIAARSLILFLALGILASATYIVNDLLDIAADRHHPRKRVRPIAAGLISAHAGAVVAAILVVVAMALSLALPFAAAASLVAYLVITLAYSLVFKQMPIVDVFVLASLFTLRVFAGAALLPVPASPWLLTFSMLFFLGLALVKRYAELARVVREGGDKVVSRGYTAKDLPLVLAAGVASGFAAIVIVTIYLINEHYPSGLYSRPELLWGLMPVILLWTLRTWHITVHERMNEDPVVFALKDRFSLGLAAISAVLLVAAWLP